MEQKIYDLIDSYRDEMTDTLIRWIQTPSVKAPAVGDAPFGEDVKKMLSVALRDCEKIGLPTRNFDNYAADATLEGKDAEAIAVLCHLDVVPEGDGWQVPPFSATREGNKIIGRGTSDDKGPAICALYAIKALKEAGIPLKKSIRLILGCDEESGWEDMRYYAEHTEMREVGFSPDASFPCINIEKGTIGFKLHAVPAKTGLQVKRMYIGERTNVIPGEAVCLVEGGQEIVGKVKAYAEKTGFDCSASVTPEGVELKAVGIPGHAAYPWGKRNAIGMMLLLLRELGVEGPFKTLADTVGMEYDGKSLGIAYEDDISGSLTCNIGILHIEEDGRIFATLDCRCPVSCPRDEMMEIGKSKLVGFEVSAKGKEAHHVPAESQLVTELLAAYHEETGLPAEPEFTGGGTYAKVLKQGVAFGASFPDDEDLAHQAGEYITIDKMILAAKVYANALLRLCR